MNAMVESMENPSDMLLVERIRRGEQQAFVLLVRRYERSLAALIGRRLGATGDVAAVEDLLQETFVHAWRGLAPGSRELRNVRAWLYQVARNRCADYLRSAQRREDTVDDEALASMVNRLGVVDDRQRRLAADVVEAFDTVPERERQALRSFSQPVGLRRTSVEVRRGARAVGAGARRRAGEAFGGAMWMV